MKITKRWLQSKSACSEGIKWVVENCKDGEAVDVINTLMADNKFDWANWLIVRVMTRPQYLQYAIFSAEQVLEIFEKRYPTDKRPRKAIEAAREVLKNDTKEIRAAVGAAAGAARDAVGAAARDARAAVGAAAGAARDAAGAAAVAAEAAVGAAARDARDAARDAAVAAEAAVGAVGAARAAARDARDAARDAAWASRDAAQKEMQKKIINYGVSLIKEMD